MTNFEKWKLNLTVDDFLNMIDDDYYSDEIPFDCVGCPAIKSEGCGDLSCRDIFRKWAEASAEE